MSLPLKSPATGAATSEAELIARLRRGESAAAYEFYEGYGPRIYRFISNALAGYPAADAEDLLQETLMGLADALPFFRGESSLFTFACAIAHRKLASFVRRTVRRERAFRPIIPSWIAEAGDVPSEPGSELMTAMARIKPEYRELLLLKYVEELKVDEIARTFEITQHAVESRLARARRALKRELGERDESR